MSDQPDVITGGYRFVLRADDVIMVTTVTGIPVDVIPPSDRDRYEDPPLTDFASEWISQWGATPAHLSHQETS